MRQVSGCGERSGKRPGSLNALREPHPSRAPEVIRARRPSDRTRAVDTARAASPNSGLRLRTKSSSEA